MSTGNQEALRSFVRGVTHNEVTLLPLNGDASFRRYYRVANSSLIAVDSPPDSQKNHEFVAIDKALLAAGIRVPQVLKVDFDRGFLLEEDLGDRTFAAVARGKAQQEWYDKAVDLLPELALCQVEGLPRFDEAFISRELGIFSQWMIEKRLHLDLSLSDGMMLEDTFAQLTSKCLRGPTCTMHRDYHSRNLLVTGDELAVIDFQDMVEGPLTYDLASLLFDCYVNLPEDLIQREIDRAYAGYRTAGLIDSGFSKEDFESQLYAVSLQRHLKVLGIFVRLSLRDGKDGYLKDLPRVLDYAITECRKLPAFESLGKFLQDNLSGKI